MFENLRPYGIRGCEESVTCPWRHLPFSLRPQTEDVERQLELALPEEEVTEPGELLKMVENLEPISDKVKELLIKMMEHTSEAYFQAAQAAEQFTQLARECSTPQLMTIMKYAV